MLRQKLQDHMDLRVVREEQQARGHRAPMTGTDGDHQDPAGDRARKDTGHAVRHSRSLAKLAAVEAARGSFDAAHDAVTRRLGPVIGKRQHEQSVAGAAVDIPAFYAARIPEPCTSRMLACLSVS